MTEKVKRYMDFMGPAPRSARVVSSDPLANRSASRSLKSSTTYSSRSKTLSKSPSASEDSLALKSLKSPSKPVKKPLKTASPTKDSDVLAKKAATALSGSNLKSPFLSSYNIEKRPLSDSIKEKKVEEIPKKNVYSRPSDSSSLAPKPSKKSVKKDPVVVIDQPKKSSGLSFVIIIFIVILIGGALGAGAYFLLPK